MSKEVKTGREAKPEEVQKIEARKNTKAPEPEAEGQFIVRYVCYRCGTPQAVSSNWDFFICAWCGAYNAM